MAYAGYANLVDSAAKSCNSFDIKNDRFYWKKNNELMIDRYLSPFDMKTSIVREDTRVSFKKKSINGEIIDTLFVMDGVQVTRDRDVCWSFDCEIEWKNGQCQRYTEIGKNGKIEKISGCDNYLKYNGYSYSYDSLGNVSEKECYLGGDLVILEECQ